MRWTYVLTGKRSELDFTDRMVESHKLEAILRAGKWSPNPLNTQPWEFAVIDDKEIIRHIVKEGELKGVAKKIPLAVAPLIKLKNPKIKEIKNKIDDLPLSLLQPVIKLAKIKHNAKGRDKSIRNSYFGLGIATYNMCLHARSLGIRSCMLTADYENIRKKIKIGGWAEIPIIVVFGYEDGKKIKLDGSVRFENSPAGFEIQDLSEFKTLADDYEHFDEEKQNLGPGLQKGVGNRYMRK